MYLYESFRGSILGYYSLEWLKNTEKFPCTFEPLTRPPGYKWYLLYTDLVKPQRFTTVHHPHGKTRHIPNSGWFFSLFFSFFYSKNKKQQLGTLHLKAINCALTKPRISHFVCGKHSGGIRTVWAVPEDRVSKWGIFDCPVNRGLITSCGRHCAEQAPVMSGPSLDAWLVGQWRAIGRK